MSGSLALPPESGARVGEIDHLRRAERARRAGRQDALRALLEYGRVGLTHRARGDVAAGARVRVSAAAAPSVCRASSSPARTDCAVPNCVRRASGRAPGSARTTARRAGAAVIEVASTISGRNSETAGAVL